MKLLLHLWSFTAATTFSLKALLDPSTLPPLGHSLTWAHGEKGRARRCLLYSPWTGSQCSIRHAGNELHPNLNPSGRKLKVPRTLQCVSRKEGREKPQQTMRWEQFSFCASVKAVLIVPKWKDRIPRFWELTGLLGPDPTHRTGCNPFIALQIETTGRKSSKATVQGIKQIGELA